MNRPTAYEYRICPTRPRIIQVREYSKHDTDDVLWRTYMRCVDAERAKEVLAMLGTIEQERE